LLDVEALISSALGANVPPLLAPIILRSCFEIDKRSDEAFIQRREGRARLVEEAGKP
jgi:hypothetical protein